MDSASLVAILLTILFVSTLVRSTFGFGDALIAMPLLAFAVDLDIARPLVALVSTTVSVVVLRQDWRHLGGSGLWVLVVAAIIGIPFGFLAAERLDESVVKMILAIIIIAYATFSLARPNLPEIKNNLFACLFGFVAGVLGGAYNTSGPPLIVYASARKWDAQRFRAILQGAYLPIAVVTLLGHTQQGNVSHAVLLYYLFSVPLVILAIAAGRRVNQRFRGQRFTAYVQCLLLVIGVALLIHSARTMLA